MRIFRLIATPVILLGLLGLLIWGGLWGWRNLTAPIPTPPPTPCVQVSANGITSKDVVLHIYNGGYTRGLAHRVATHMKENGFVVDRIANTDEAIRGTIIRGGKNAGAALKIVSANLPDAKVETVDRIDGIVDILVGTEFQGYSEKPIVSIGVDGNSVCKPAVLVSPSPSPSGKSASPKPSASPSQPGQKKTN